MSCNIWQQKSSSRRSSSASVEENDEPEKAVVDSQVNLMGEL